MDAGSLTEEDVIAPLDHAQVADGPGGPNDGARPAPRALRVRPRLPAGPAMVPGRNHVRFVSDPGLPPINEEAGHEGRPQPAPFATRCDA